MAQSSKILEGEMEGRGVTMRVSSNGMLMVSIVLLMVWAAPIAGQRVDPARARMQEMDRRELQLNALGGDRGQPNDPKRSQALMDQVNEDFKRILTLHNQIVRAIGANQSFDLQFVSEATGEIRKRSARLQSLLRLSKPETTAGPGFDPKVMEIKDELILLCKHIEGFIKNPIIDKPGTVDAQQLRNARRDLQSVVEVSEAIKKHVDKQKP